MGGFEYLDLDLLVEQRGEGYRARVINSPAGQAQADFSRPFDPVELENFYLRVGRPRQGVRRIDSPEMEAVKRYGKRLFEAIFGDEVYACLRSSLSVARAQEKGLRLRLRVDAPELSDYPWEFLYNPRLNRFLCLSTETPLVRYLELASPVTALPVSPPLNLLVMVAGPHDYPPLDTGRELEKLVTGLEPLVRSRQVCLERVEPPTLETLQRLLRRGQYHIFHFIGHGGFDERAQDGVLMLEDEKGRGRMVSGSYLGTLLHDHRPLRLVLLNACEGARTSSADPFAGLAQTLVQQGIPAVIAMQFEITDEAAITFAQEFYAAIADGYPVDGALAEARKAIFAKGNDIEWGTPVYFTRTPDGRIFDVQPVAALVADDLKPLTDQRLEKELARLYDDGLSAYWLKDWARAGQIFTHLLTLRSNYPGAAEKLAEADFQSELVGRYSEAKAHLDAEEWGAAVEALQALEKLEPEYEDTTQLMEKARTLLQVDELYQQASRLYEAGHWQAVNEVFQEIRQLAPDFSDQDQLWSRSQAELAEEQRQEMLSELYRQALAALESRDWGAAHDLLIKIQGQEPDFRDSAGLLQRAGEEIERQKSERQRKEQVDALYEQALGLARARQWGEVLEKVQAIKELEPTFDDPEGVEARARGELSSEQAEAQRQRELAGRYSKAVNLLESGEYQAALEKWAEVHSRDPGYPDRQKVEARARKQLQLLAKAAAPKRTRPGWLKSWMPAAAVIAVLAISAGLVLVFNPPGGGSEGSATQPAAALVRQATATPRPTSTTRSAGGAVQPAATSTARPAATKTARPYPTPMSTHQPVTGFWEAFDTQPDGSALDADAWNIWTEESINYDVHIQDQSLYLWVEGKDKMVEINPKVWIDLVSTEALYFQADFMLDKASYGGHAGLYLDVSERSIGCAIWSQENDFIVCANGEVYDTMTLRITPGTWHTIRLEIDANTPKAEIYIDGDFYASVPFDLSGINPNQRWVSFVLQLVNRSEKNSVGYIDNLQIGPLP